ncbi:hypothetical protein CI610_02092 [invertebrate metagenome]|uniref:Uncharacterized protein n=1 Tax=invertebrate metagenome TaxID=1711999 RepID=A0A2H9T6X7_9ZZZZ
MPYERKKGGGKVYLDESKVTFVTFKLTTKETDNDHNNDSHNKSTADGFNRCYQEAHQPERGVSPLNASWQTADARAAIHTAAITSAVDGYLTTAQRLEPAPQRSKITLVP